MVIIGAGPQMMVSTNSGTNWFGSSVPGSPLVSLTASADGSKLYGAVIFGSIYLSQDRGVTWTPTTATPNKWYSVSCSADGTKLAAVHGTPQVTVSTNSGLNWFDTDVAEGTNFNQQVVCSADGSTLVVPGYYIFTSTNFGANWTKTASPYAFWFSIACSADASHITAVGRSGQKTIVYSTADSGATWTSNNVPDLSWYRVASSADGNVRFLTASSPDVLYTSQAPPNPQLRLSVSGPTVAVSWWGSPTIYELQQKLNLSDQWSAVPEIPVLDPVTLRQRVNLSKVPGAAFFRLVSQ